MKIEGKGKQNKIEAEEMALESKSNPIEEEHQDEGDDVEEEIHHDEDELARNPSAPPDYEVTSQSNGFSFSFAY